MLSTPMGPGFFIFFQDASLGGDDAPTLIVYDDLPVKTVKKLAKKVKKYAGKKKVINPADIEAIASSMVDTWERKEVEVKMLQYKIDEQQALAVYKATLEELMSDDLALLLILMEI